MVLQIVQYSMPNNGRLRLLFDDGDEARLKPKRPCYPQGRLILGIAPPFTPPPLIIVRPPSESCGRRVDIKINLNFRLWCLPAPLISRASTCASEIWLLRLTSPEGHRLSLRL